MIPELNISIARKEGNQNKKIILKMITSKRQTSKTKQQIFEMITVMLEHKFRQKEKSELLM